LGYRCPLVLVVAAVFLLTMAAGSGIVSAVSPSWIVVGEEIYQDEFFLVDNDVIVEEAIERNKASVPIIVILPGG